MATTLDKWIQKDKSAFAKQKSEIQARLAGKTGILDHVADDCKEDVFYMLCFCLLVPQSKQVLAEEAEKLLRKADFYNKPMPQEELANLLRGKARFQNTKAKRLLQARQVFLETDFWDSLKTKFKSYSEAADDRGVQRALINTRVWLDSKINGMGLKLASHFMRNIGMRGLAILDSHVRNAMKDRCGVGNPGDILKKNEYYAMESRVKDYASKVGISLDELDLLLCGHRK